MAQKTTTQKGKPKLIENGFQYTQKRVSRTKTSWVCSVSGCPGKGKSSNDADSYETTFVATNTNHNHGQDLIYERRQKVTEEIIESVNRNLDLSNRVIANRIIWAGGIQTAALFRNFGSLYRKMRRHRETIINPGPYAIEEPRLSDRLTKTARGLPFYQYGPGNDRGLSFDST